MVKVVSTCPFAPSTKRCFCSSIFRSLRSSIEGTQCIDVLSVCQIKALTMKGKECIVSTIINVKSCLQFPNSLGDVREPGIDVSVLFSCLLCFFNQSFCLFVVGFLFSFHFPCRIRNLRIYVMMVCCKVFGVVFFVIKLFFCLMMIIMYFSRCSSNDFNIFMMRRGCFSLRNLFLSRVIRL